MVNIEKVITSYCRDGRLVEIDRRIPGAYSVDGYILWRNSAWFVVQVYYDFFFDGYAFLKIEDVVSIRSGASERHTDRILRSEIVLRDPSFAMSIKGERISDCLKLLKRAGRHVAIQTEWPESECFYIGQIVSVRKHVVIMTHYDARGQWDEEFYTIPYDTISKISFDTNYIRHTSRYVCGPSPELTSKKKASRS